MRMIYEQRTLDYVLQHMQNKINPKNTVNCSGSQSAIQAVDCWLDGTDKDIENIT